MIRRDFLKGLAAGAALPLVGCGTRSGPDLKAIEAIPGRILGANFKFGHLMRDGKLPTHQGPRRQLAVAILGGGVAGLGAAWKLKKSGIDDFHVFEVEGSAGGNSRCQSYPESKAPWGAHYLPVPTHESKSVRELLLEMGVMQSERSDGTPIYREEDICHDPEERIFAFGTWEDGLFPKFGATRADLQQFEEFNHHLDHWRDWRDKKGRKAFAIPLELSSDAPELKALDQVSMLDYMNQHGWTSPRLRFYAEYGCRDDYGTSLKDTSAWAALHYWSCRDGGGFEMRDAQFVWPEGNQRLVQHMLDSIGNRVTTGAVVARIEPVGGGVDIDLINVYTGESIGIHARSCIYALPTFLRPYLMGASQPKRPEFVYAPWVVANLVLERLPQDLPHTRHRLRWDNVIYESESLGYVLSTHQSLARQDHPTVLTWYRPHIGSDTLAERKKILARSWESWREEIMTELCPLHPGIEKSARRLDVMLLGHAMIRPSVNFMWSEARLAANQASPPCYFAHSDLSGISIFEQAHFQGVRAAQNLMRDWSHRYEDSLQ